MKLRKRILPCSLSFAIAANTMCSAFAVSAFADDTIASGTETDDLPSYVDSVPADNTASNPEGVQINETNFPDSGFRTVVSNHFDDGDGVLTDEEIAAVKEITARGFVCYDLTGIKYFTALTKLDCRSYRDDYYCCYLTSLDVSNNTALRYLDCSGTGLTSLDVSGCTALHYLYCSGNGLTSLDVSKNTALQDLDCSKNQLSNLDVSKNTNLTSLVCDENQLTNLDVSKNTALRTLRFPSNQLTSLDVSNNTALRSLACANNNITRLDLSKNTALKELWCSNNPLISLDLNDNTTLDHFECFDTKSYNIGVVYRTFPLSRIKGFDASKASNWSGATYDSATNSLKDFTGGVVSYAYDYGNNRKLAFSFVYSQAYNEPIYIDVTAPTKTDYFTGESLEVDGGRITVYYNYSRPAVFDLTADMISGFDNTTPGRQTVTVTYEGFTDTFEVSVNAKDISNCAVSAIDDQLYTGAAIKPVITVTDGDKILKKGTDYKVAYSNNTNIGTATIKIVGYGGYTGTTTVKFNIIRFTKSISECTISEIVDQAYTGSAIKPVITVKDGDKKLVKGTDYKVAYSNNTNIGTAIVKVVGYGDYTGTQVVTFNIVIVKKNISNCTINAIADQTYTGSAIKPAITVKDGGKKLVKGTDYRVAYSNNIKVGTATIKVVGYGDYTGTTTVTFNIVAAPININSCTISAIADQTYTGSAIKPSITVKDGDKKLVKGTDYRVSYSNNINIGTATIKVVGYGDYSGTRTVTFEIK